MLRGSEPVLAELPGSLAKLERRLFNGLSAEDERALPDCIAALVHWESCSTWGLHGVTNTDGDIHTIGHALRIHISFLLSEPFRMHDIVVTKTDVAGQIPREEKGLLSDCLSPAQVIANRTSTFPSSSFEFLRFASSRSRTSSQNNLSICTKQPYREI